MALGAHNGLGNPKILLLEAPDIVQAKGNLVGGQRLRLSAPDRVIVVGGKVQMPGNGGVVRVLAQAAAAEVVHYHRIRDDLPQQVGLEGGEPHHALTAEALPVQPQGRVVGGDGGGGQGNFVKIVVLLGPEGGAIGVVEGLDVPVELLPQVGPEGLPALWTPAHIAALMAQLIVNLPGYDGLLVLVVLRHDPDNALGIPVQRAAVEAVHVPSAKDPLGAVLKLGEDVRVLLCKPGGDGGGGGAHDDGQSPGLGPLNDVVKEGEVVLSLRLLHAVPGKFGNADGIAPQLTDIVQVLLQQVGVPLLGIVIYTKKHKFFT